MSGATTRLPGSGVRADELADLAAMATEAGPFLSVVLTTDRATEDAARRMDAAWRDLRRDLADRGAPDPVLDAVGTWLEEHRTDGDAVACIASASGNVVGGAGPEARAPVAAWDSTPRVAQLVEWHQADPPALLVLVDRTGADLFSNVDDGPTATVDGASGPVVRRSSPGG